jgi:hypothetical protein
MPFGSTANLRGPVLRNLHQWMENSTMDMATYTPVLRAATTDPTMGTASVNQGRSIYFGQYQLYCMAYYFMGTSGFSRGSGVYNSEFDSANIEQADTPADVHTACGWGLHFCTTPTPDTRYHAHPNDALLNGTPDTHGFHHDDSNSGTTFDNAPDVFQNNDHISAFTFLPLNTPISGHGDPL